MPAPKDKKALRTFLGMATYMSKFVPNLSSAAHPLRLLLSSKVSWCWESEQDNAFQLVKNLCIAYNELATYDPFRPIKVSTDASKIGLGGC